MTSFLLLAILALIVWFWVDSLRAREVAIAAGQRVCGEINVQFLDQSVAVIRLRPARSHTGQLVLRRTFAFDYSRDGAVRRRGRVIMLGRFVERVETDEGESTTITAEKIDPP